ncbi:acyltransferase [Vibrio nigripulchritudo]|uniref:acyltransferase n=1 Tax=Vibrio nigripulchritudo TaxID=28173 RepID=UPI000571764A|nr:hypothetical protein [Vibrio nigripulchritudo]
MEFKKVQSRIVIYFNSIYLRAVSLIKYKAWISIFAEIRVEPGAKLTIGKNSRISSGSVIHVLNGAILDIKDNVWIGPYNIIYCQSGITINSGVRVAHFCTITDNDYYISNKTSNKIDFMRKRYGDIIIGQNSWLCANATILRGVKVEESSIVKPGTCLKREK